jgi:hypothetical protein
MNWLGHKVVETIQYSDGILDIGCGRFDPTGYMGSNHVGVDCFAPYLNYIQDTWRAVGILGKAPDILNCFIDNSFDHVLFLDTIEHMTKEDAMQSIAHAERLATKTIQICTPKGFREQEGLDVWGLGYNEAQAHICGFERDEFETLGYKVQDLSIESRNTDTLFAIKEM